MAAITHSCCILAPAGIAKHFITVMNNRIDDMEYFKSIEKCLGNALDQLCYEICNASRDSSNIIRAQVIYQMLEDTKSRVKNARIHKECTMNETEAMLKKLLIFNDVDDTTKAEINKSIMLHQAYQSKCDKECQQAMSQQREE
ncbi:hypothetical protein RJZ56_007983 [Blastomyces dermatitidis]